MNEIDKVNWRTFAGDVSGEEAFVNLGAKE